MYPLETWKPEGYVGPPDQKAAAVFSSDQGRVMGRVHRRRRRYNRQDPLVGPDVLRPPRRPHLHPHLDSPLRHVQRPRTTTGPSPTTRAARGRNRGPTNLRGQVCTPIPLPDGRVAAIYNFRHEPQGIHVALTEDLETFDTDGEVVVFDAGAEATLGAPETDNFLAEHMQIAFGKPGGVLLDDGAIMTYFWCTVAGITHTRWVRLRAD